MSPGRTTRGLPLVGGTAIGLTPRRGQSVVRPDHTKTRGVSVVTEFWAPWITDPDDPNVGLMTVDEALAAAAMIATMYPELIDHSLDGPVLSRLCTEMS